MSVIREEFGKDRKGNQITKFAIENGGVTLKVLNYGAIISDLFLPDREGKTDNCVLGFDNIEGYESNPNFLGATIAPSANRVGGASFKIDGKTYHLPVNENGVNNLHTDRDNGTHKRIWDTEVLDDHSVRFSISLADGEFGTPGNRTFTLTYEVTEQGTVRLSYHGDSDVRTIMNPTNHAYYNLHGAGKGKIRDMLLTLTGSSFTPVDKFSIPTGEIREVAGTPFDFTTPKEIGRDIDDDDAQLRITGGYDHNYAVDGWNGDGTLRAAAVVCDPVTGRKMDVYTTLPGVQFYAGCALEEPAGRDGVHYSLNDALCLETQYYPDSINNEHFETPVFGQENSYDSVTEYRFTVM